MDKRQILLHLLEKSENSFKKFSKGGFFNQMKKLMRYRGKYLKYAISELTKKPLLVKGKTFWGEDFFTHLPGDKYIFLFNILGDSEIKLTKFFIKNLKSNSIFFDIGANYGFYSLLAKQLITDGQVHAFEPTPTTFKFLQKNLSNKDRIFLNQIAFFDSEGIINFYENLVGKSGLNTFNVFNIKPILFKQTRVKTTTLDKYCLYHSKPTFIKIDVEGAEGNVVEGAIETLKKSNPIITMEVRKSFLNNEEYLKPIKILKGLGYKLYSIVDNGELKEKEIIDSERDILGLVDNFVFIKI